MTAILNFLNVDSMLELWWVVIGLGGQLMFTTRFLVQWIASERAGRSVVPIAFWYFSISGGVILLAYAIYRADPVFILGQSLGVFIYSRNLWLIHAEKKRAGLSE
jgi:lipid-A-disaccharide synthase-like uncharacterized protein